MEKLSLLRNDLTSKRANITRDLEKFKAVSGNNSLYYHDLLSVTTLQATTIACKIPVEELIETMNELDLTK